ncbi:MAG: hypothetical protein MK110_13840 [Fuerstiella sp.]|nr:hypothetical protein [Fuerstiella sp.]
MNPIRQPWLPSATLIVLMMTSASAQENTPNERSELESDGATTAVPAQPREAPDGTPGAELWNRLIYVPFGALNNVFNNEPPAAVVPYDDYFELRSTRSKKQRADVSPDAVVTKAVYTAAIEEDIAKISVKFDITILKQDGWARLPLTFGNAAVSRITSDSDDKTILKGSNEGEYDLLLQGTGLRTVTLELLASVVTTPEARSFELNCPIVGINELHVTVPEQNQTIRISPHEFLLPVEDNNNSRSVAKAALGATQQFSVHWFPKAGSRPVQNVVGTVVSKAAIEIVTEKQPLASYRCRYQITTTERQRLKIEVPTDSELQAPLLNNRRTTLEPAEDTDATEGWQPYYINISRKEASDRAFLLSFRFRCPIVDATRIPYEGQGGIQLLRTPRIGHDSKSTVVQETRIGIWTPNDVVVSGEPEHWTAIHTPSWSILHPPKSSQALNVANSLGDWIGDESTSSEFAHQGNAAVFRTQGSKTILQTTWWNRPFVTTIVSGALILMGFVLRRTSWENRITLVLVSLVIVTFCGLFDNYAVRQAVDAGAIGLMAVAAIWTINLVVSQSSHRESSSPTDNNKNNNQTDGKDHSLTANSRPKTRPAKAQPHSPATVTPTPVVRKTMDKPRGSK